MKSSKFGCKPAVILLHIDAFGLVGQSC